MNPSKKPMGVFIKRVILILELIAVYGVLAFAAHQFLISRDLLYLLLSLTGLIFSLYYGIKGTMGSVAGSTATIAFLFGASTFSFLSQHYVEISFFIAAMLITGFVKSGMESKVIGMEIASEVLNRRIERFTVELSEKDRALQEALQEVLTDLESPKIMYQALRRIEKIQETETLFDEILNILYTHCHVEKSVILEVRAKKSLKKVTSFGASAMPDSLDWKNANIPEILRAAMVEREVIVPTRLNNRLVMAVPILSMKDELRYILLIEEIRFINFSENVINLLKVAAFWMKYLIEYKLYLNELLNLSVFSSTVVYRSDLSQNLLKSSVSTHKKYHLPFALLTFQGTITEEKAHSISKALRIYDDLFMIADDKLIIFLSMVMPQNVPFVFNRLTEQWPEDTIEQVTAKLVA